MTEKKIDDYIESVAPFAQAICRKVRAAIHKADPGIAEEWKWRCPHFSKQGLVCGFAAFKEHVSVGFHKGPLFQDAKKLLENKRMLKFRSVGDVDEKVLIGFVKQAVELNANGKKVNVRKAEIPMPADLKAALAKDAMAKSEFESFAPGYRREYLEWIVGAKRPETRAQRIETTVKQSRAGKTLNWKYQK